MDNTTRDSNVNKQRTTKMTKQARIDALSAALSKISQQTKGYDSYSQIGCLHDIAHNALIADILLRK